MRESGFKFEKEVVRFLVNVKVLGGRERGRSVGLGGSVRLIECRAISCEGGR